MIALEVRVLILFSQVDATTQLSFFLELSLIYLLIEMPKVAQHKESTSDCVIRVTQVCSLAMCCRAASIPEAQDLSRSSSNASSFASVVEEHEAEDEYDTGLVGGTKIRQQLPSTPFTFIPLLLQGIISLCCFFTCCLL